MHPLPSLILLLNWCQEYSYRLRNWPSIKKSRQFLNGGIILGSPLSCPYLFLYMITCHPLAVTPTLSYTALELTSRVLLSSKKLARGQLEKCTVKKNDILHARCHNCSLPFWRVHGIKRMHLASRTHGLFIT
jgi:hypothetical protein